MAVRSGSASCNVSGSSGTYEEVVAGSAVRANIADCLEVSITSGFTRYQHSVRLDPVDDYCVRNRRRHSVTYQARS
jgi:hypothetical protein